MKKVDLSAFEMSTFSRGGEDGVIEQISRTIFPHMGPASKYFVDIGVQDAVRCNTRLLRERYLWNGLFLDARNRERDINLHKEYVTRENVKAILSNYKVPSVISCFSIDIGYNDFYILQKVLTEYHCDIVVCNYNASHSPAEDKIVKYKRSAQWDGTSYFGASLRSLCLLLCHQHNFSLVYCDSQGSSCFFVHNSRLHNKEIEFKNQNQIDLLYKPPRVGNTHDRSYPQDNLNREFISYINTVF